jgi:hypothetical protein
MMGQQHPLGKQRRRRGSHPVRLSEQASVESIADPPATYPCPDRLGRGALRFAALAMRGMPRPLFPRLAL